MQEEILKKVSDLLGVAQEFITVENAKELYSKIVEAQILGNTWNTIAFFIWLVLSTIVAIIIMKYFDRLDNISKDADYHSGGYYVTLIMYSILNVAVLVAMIPVFKAVYMWKVCPEAMFINWIR